MNMSRFETREEASARLRKQAYRELVVEIRKGFRWWHIPATAAYLYVVISLYSIVQIGLGANGIVYSPFWHGPWRALFSLFGG